MTDRHTLSCSSVVPIAWRCESLLDFGLPTQSRWSLSSVQWQFLADVSGQPIGLIFKGYWVVTQKGAVPVWRSAFCPHGVLVVCASLGTAIISQHSINWLVFVMDTLFSVRKVITTWSTVFFEKVVDSQLIKKFPVLYATHISLPYAQDTATCHYREPH